MTNYRVLQKHGACARACATETALLWQKRGETAPLGQKRSACVPETQCLCSRSSARLPETQRLCCRISACVVEMQCSCCRKGLAWQNHSACAVEYVFLHEAQCLCGRDTVTMPVQQKPSLCSRNSQPLVTVTATATACTPYRFENIAFFFCVLEPVTSTCSKTALYILMFWTLRPIEVRKHTTTTALVL